MPAIHVPKRTYTVRPYRFTLDPDHPLGQGLVFAGLGNVAGSGEYLDSSVHRNDGTLVNMDPATDWVAGLRRKAIETDEAGTQYIILPDLGAAENRNFTFCCWVKTTETGPSNYLIGEGNLGNNDPIAGLANDTNVTRGFIRRISADQIDLRGSTIINDGAWHHTCLICDGITAAIYADGNLEDSGSAPALDLDLNTTTLCALRRTTTGQYVTGISTDFLIYDCALNLSKIAQLADPDNVMLSGLVREAPKPKTYFFPAEITPTLGYRVLDGPKRKSNTRPYRFKLNTSHPFAQDLIWASLGNTQIEQNSLRIVDSSPYNWPSEHRDSTGCELLAGRKALKFSNGYALPVANLPHWSGENNVSLFCYFRRNDIAYTGGLIHHIFGNDDTGLRLYLLEVSSVWQLRATLAGQAIIGNARNADQIYSAAVTYDGTDIRLYEDGNEVNVVNFPGEPPAATVFAVGSYFGTEQFFGTIGDCLAYSRTLNADEIKEMSRPENFMYSGMVEAAPKRQDVVIPKQPAPPTGVIIYPSVTKRRHTFRPHRFKLDENHPLAEGLVFAGLGNCAGGNTFWDSSVYRNHGGVEAGGLWGSRIGRRGVILDAASSQYVSTPLAAVTGITSITIACFVIADSTPANFDPVFGNQGAGGRFLQIWANSSKWSFDVGGDRTTGNTTIVVGRCDHVALTVEGTTATLYVNGVYDSQHAAVTWSGSWSAALRVGGRYNDYWPGQIYDPVIYNRILSPAEIRTLADPDNIMLSGLIQPITQQDFVYSPPAPPIEFKSTIFRSRLIRGTSC